MFGLGAQEILLLAFMVIGFGTVIIIAVLGLRHSRFLVSKALEEENRRLRDQLNHERKQPE